MKRKQLQALCKQHKIPANLSNRDMADKLTEFLKVIFDLVFSLCTSELIGNNRVVYVVGFYFWKFLSKFSLF